MIIDKIIKYIRDNRVSTTEIADCLGKTGLVQGATAINKGHFIVGKVHYSYCDGESNYNVHKTIRELESNSIVFIDDLGANGRAIFGDLVSKYLLLYKQAAAIVTNGKIRDAHTIIKENYPIWASGVSPIGCFNAEPKNPVNSEILKKRMQYFDGSLIVADDSGVVLVTKDLINEEFYKKLEWIEEQEDIWFNCIDRLKFDTFDTVVRKKYLKLDKNIYISKCR